MEWESHRPRIVPVVREELTAEKAHKKMLDAEARLAICEKLFSQRMEYQMHPERGHPALRNAGQ